LSPFSIRKASSGDADGILECLQDAFEAYRNSYTRDAFIDTVLTPETLRERLATMCVFVAASQADEIVGNVACNVVSAEEGHVRGMAVRPAWHGAGVASELLATVESELRESGCSRISLDTTAPLKRAMRFYERHGYRRSGKVTEFFGMRLFEYVKELD
jgi:predicted N-acetyltransferase YhbS